MRQRRRFIRIGNLGLGDPGALAFGWRQILGPIYWHDDDLERDYLRCVARVWSVEIIEGESVQAFRERVRREIFKGARSR